MIHPKDESFVNHTKTLTKGGSCPQSITSSHIGAGLSRLPWHSQLLIIADLSHHPSYIISPVPPFPADLSHHPSYIISPVPVFHFELIRYVGKHFYEGKSKKITKCFVISKQIIIFAPKK